MYCGGHPTFEEFHGRGTIARIPDVFKLVLEHPGAMDAAMRRCDDRYGRVLRESNIMCGAKRSDIQRSPPGCMIAMVNCQVDYG